MDCSVILVWQSGGEEGEECHHYVYVQPVSALLQNRLALLRQTREIRGQDGWADDGAGPVPSRPPSSWQFPTRHHDRLLLTDKHCITQWTCGLNRDFDRILRGGRSQVFGI